MTTKIVKDERTQKEILFDRLLRVGEVGRDAIKKEKDISYILNGLQLLAEGKKILSALVDEKSDWLTDILTRERQTHLAFFGREFDLIEFEKILRKYGRKKVKEWMKLGMEPHFLPKVSMMAGDDYPGWKIKPEEWFFKKQIEGKLLCDIKGDLKKVTTVELEGVAVLIDTLLKPAYENDKQMYKDDNMLGPVIEKLRKAGKILKYEYCPQSSRFGISADEWESHIKTRLAEKLSLAESQLRLERAIEANIIPQLYPYMSRKDDGNTNTWVWYEEYFGDRGRRLAGGRSGYGGLARVHWGCSDGHWGSLSFRPLAVL